MHLGRRLRGIFHTHNSVRPGDGERYTALRPLGNDLEGDGIRFEGLGSARIAEGSAR
jgi:hypothetical protein